MSRPFKQREVACARCFRLKRKCDHVKPTCGECRRKGAECLPARSRRSGDEITVSLGYLKGLERRLAELESANPTENIHTGREMCDAGVQTDPLEWESNRGSTSSDLWMYWEANRETRPDKKNDLLQEARSEAVSEAGPLMLLSGLTPQARTPSFADIFTRLEGENLNFLHFDKTLASPLAGYDSQWLPEIYTAIYFSICHREWPFLNESAWQAWHKAEGSARQEEWQKFFVRMVYAIGASLCSTMHRDPAHLARSKELYTSAMDYYPYVVGHSSMVLQVQASLLLVVYALHCPSAEEIATTVSSIIPFCTAAMTEIRKFAQTGLIGEVTAVSGEMLTENMFIACFMLNVIVASGWDRPVSAAYRALDDDMCILGDTIEPPVTTNPALGHLFRLRKIQANIRRSRESSRWQFAEEKNAFNSSLKSALNIWRQDIPRYGTANVSCGFYHPSWMTKLYDYSILILMEDKHNFLEEEGVQNIFAAVVEVCLKFRWLQEEGHVMCFTWSALVYQFRAGIMLLYLIWTTRPAKSRPDNREQNHIYHSPEAVEACTKTLACFADRWDDAKPYFKVFSFLRQKTLWDDTLRDGIATLEETECDLDQLKKNYLHRAILGMIEDMLYGVSVQHEPMLDDYVTGVL
ncbi:hypothetical protein N7492_007200 [Penicillium capsulatum]|uniref:Zn(2)-C6 fungal-type domain-containing protein n=1 Tax=Penicillium capsulatum TaxID=69766 RepID=A0A9W9LLK3_9EURO|nr:hypothetical protein N7492_007200 [Penicillium capsulatum]KAJ6117038.1 hypothetical protein N7512_006763 [Penicillium capsulatum]